LDVCHGNTPLRADLPLEDFVAGRDVQSIQIRPAENHIRQRPGCGLLMMAFTRPS